MAETKPITRRDLITGKYNEFLAKINPIIGSGLFPSLEDYDLADLLFLLDTFFPDSNTDDNLRQILFAKGMKLPAEDIAKLVVIIDDCIKFVSKNIK